MTRLDPGKARGPSGSPRDLRLTVLGSTELRRDGIPASPVLAQPKRLALLAYLLLARPGSFQRRDHLLGLFWPGSTPTRARANLRQAVRFLRKSLGDGVIVGRGDGELAAAESAMTCDVLDFRDALGAGDLEAALGLYRGELMPGLFVSGAPEFERWLSAERRALREAAREAAASLAEEAEAGGRIEGAIDWARRATTLDPLDETSCRRLLRILDRAGRRAEAVATYEDFRSRLAAELEVEPSPETEALARGLRGEETPGAGGPSAPEGAGLDPRRVLVLPYRNRTGDPAHEVLGTVAADWIAQALARNPELSVVPPIVARSAGAPAEPRTDEPDGALLRPAEALAAGTVVTGAVELLGSEVVLRTTLFDVVRRRLLPPPDPVSSPGGEPFRELEALGDAVAGCLAPLLSTQSVHARSAGRPPGFEAYRAYLEGLDHFIDGDWAEALGGFRRAMEQERSYALPRVVSAIALWNLGRLPEALAVARQAEALRSNLGPFERGTLDMVLGWLQGDWRSAYEGARRQADLAPGSLPAFQVAEEARRLNRPGEALRALAALDPTAGELQGWIYYWVELCTAHHLLGDHRAELAAARRAVSLHPGHALATLAELRALAALGDHETLRERGYRVLATPPGGSPSPGALLRRTALELAAHGHEPEDRRFLEMSEEWWSEQGALRDPLDRRERALTLYHLGRLEEAREILIDLVAGGGGVPAPVDDHHGHLEGHLDEGLLALIADRLGDEEETARWRHRLEELDEPFVYGGDRLWLAALAARGGEIERGVSHLRRAFIQGLPFGIGLHAVPDLAPLRGHPGFRGIMAPKG